MADIRLIAEHCSLFDIDSATSEEPGFEIENMQDFKTYSSWKATSNAQQDIIIDTNDLITPMNYILIHHNISIFDNAEITIYSDDNDAFTSPTTHATSGTLDAAQIPFLYMVLGVSVPERYIRIRISALSAGSAEVISFWLGGESGASDGITIRPMFGDSNEKVYDGNVIVESPGGYKSSRIFHDGREQWEYQYELLDATNEAKLQSFIDLTNGAGKPFIFGDLDGNYHYVRLGNNRIGSIQAVDVLFNTGRLLIREEF